MAKAKNILWIMCDQLRHDYLGCTGHPTLKTRNIDAMAAQGVRSTNAYVPPMPTTSSRSKAVS
jgi:arylsulfatase A-like enzyme